MRYKIHLVSLLIAIGWSTVAFSQTDNESNADPMIEQLGSPQAPERVEAMKQLAQRRESAVEPLLEVLDTGKQNARKMAYRSLFTMVQDVADTDQAPAVAKALCAGLKGDHLASTKRDICELLSYVAGDESVDLIYRFVGDPEIGEMARWALVRIETRRAAQSLVGGLQITADKVKIGVINALGERQLGFTAPYLMAMAAKGTDDQKAAALEALAKTPAPESVEFFETALLTERAEVIDASLRYAQTMVKAGGRNSAKIILLKVADVAELTPVQQCNQVYAWGLLGGIQGTQVVLKKLESGQPKIRGAAVEAGMLLPGEDATNMIADKLSDASAERKVDLLRILAGRGRNMTPEAGDKIIALAKKADGEAVQLAAVEAIHGAGISTGTKTLIDCLDASSESVAMAAERALNHMGGEEVTDTIADAVAKASPATQGKLVLALGHRGGPAALPTVLKASESDHEHVRVAAFKALGILQADRGVEPLMSGLGSDSEKVRQAAAHALRKMSGADTTRKLVSAYKDAQGQRKVALLEVLGYRKDPRVTELLSEEIQVEDPDLRAAAIAGLGRQSDPSLAPTLLKVAKEGPEQVTKAAIEGYLRAAQILQGTDRSKAGAMYFEALKLAVTDEHKQEALQGVFQFTDPKRIDVLPVIKPFLDAPCCQEIAARAAARFASHLPEDEKEEAVAVLKKVIKRTTEKSVIQAAVDELHKRGVQIDPAHDAGFITHWWLAGPMPNAKDRMFNNSYGPEDDGVDLDKPVTVDGKKYSWQKHHETDIQGVILMDDVLGSRNDVGAYGYAEITVDEAQDVVFRMGSDDGIVVWVNGKQIHANNARRGLQIDQDQAEAHLKEGKNEVLIKILNGAQAWAYCVRVMTPDGEPVEFTQRKK